MDKVGDYTLPLRFPACWMHALANTMRLRKKEESRPGEAPRPIVRDGIAKVYMS